MCMAVRGGGDSDSYRCELPLVGDGFQYADMAHAAGSHGTVAVEDKPAVHEEYTVPVASGIIAGESLMGVRITLLVVTKVLE